MPMPQLFGNDRTFKQLVVWITTFLSSRSRWCRGGDLFFSWKAFVIAMFLWWVAGGLGVGVGYHRLLAHRDCKMLKCMEYALTVSGILALEGGPILWVETHRMRYQSSRHGLAWYEFDLNWYGICALRGTCLDVKAVSLSSS